MIRINKYKLWIIMLICLQTSFFDLAGDLTNWALLAILLFDIYILVIEKKIIYSTRKNGAFSYWFIALVIAYFVSSVIGSYRFGSSVLENLYSSRGVFICTLSYFALNKLFKAGRLVTEDLEDIISKIASFQLIVYYIQFILKDNIIFTHALVGNRYGSSRFYFDIGLIVIMFFLCLDNVIVGKKTVINIIYMVAIIFEIVMINQYRMSTISVLAAGVFVFIISKGKTRRKFALIPILILAWYILAGTNLYQDTMRSIFVADESGSLTGRSAFIRWTLNNIFIEHHYFGMGLITNQEGISFANNNIFNHYYIGDHGIWSLLFELGILIAVLWIWLIVLLIRKAKNNINVSHHSFFYGYAIFILINSYSENYWFLLFGLFNLSMVLLMAQYGWNEGRELI